MSEARLTDGERATVLRLARAAIADGLTGDGSLDRVLREVTPTPATAAPRGLFVTLKLVDRTRPGMPALLRGCIGSMESARPLLDAVADVARKAAFEDPRFPPLTEAEWSDVRLSISVLTPCAAIDDPSEIVVGRDGVQLEKGPYRAVFLPQVAEEQSWTVDLLLENLALKAGLPRDGWKTGRLSTFRAEVFGDRSADT